MADAKLWADKLDAYLEEHRSSMVDDICHLVEIPSVSAPAVDGYPYGVEAARAVDAFGEVCKRLGFDPVNVDYRAIYASFGPDDRELDLVGHVDVVDIDDDWTVTEGFRPLVKDNLIYGRGSADDKGPMVAVLYALAAVKDLGIELKHGVRVVAGSNEEEGDHEDYEYYLEREGEPSYTLSPDGDYPVINVEKGYFRGKTVATYASNDELPRVTSIDCGEHRWVVPGEAEATIEGLACEELAPYIEAELAATGVAVSAEDEDGHVRLVARGRNSHVGALERGNNALTGMLHFLASLPLAKSDAADKIRALVELFPHGDHACEACGIARKTDTVGGDLTGTYNILHADEKGFVGSFDCKTSEDCTEENTVEVMRRAFEKHGIEARDFVLQEGLHVPLDSPLLQTALKWWSAYSGQESYGTAIAGKTYVQALKEHPGVTFGCAMPGIDNHFHFGDEFVDVDVLIMSAKIYASIIIELCA